MAETRKVSATVYIWYPKGDDFGHASMHIGAHEGRADSYQYVSWWPSNTKKLACQDRCLNDDVAAEKAEPHIRYQLFGLEVEKMIAAWEAITYKEGGANYRIVAKNCSTIVGRVLRAGGVEKLLTAANGDARLAGLAHNMVWSPKDVSNLCTAMVKMGNGNKTKSENCPGKCASPKAVGMTLVGAR